MATVRHTYVSSGLIMDMTSLTSKQKRLNDWMLALKEPFPTDALRLKVEDTLKLYRNVLAKCWEANALTSEDEATIEDLERQLEELNNEARLFAH